MKRLLVVRHGNTFRPGEVPLRVGCRTDMPLVETERATNAGRILKEKGLIPDRVFAAPLKRTVETAEWILQTMGLALTIQKLDVFSEIDYGDDEGKTEKEVMARLGRIYLEREGRLTTASEETIQQRGKQTLDDWNAKAIPPAGWLVCPDAIRQNWSDFANQINDGETVLVVSSNGIIRFSPSLLSSMAYERFVAKNALKVTTGGVCVFECECDSWSIRYWNIKPM